MFSISKKESPLSPDIPQKPEKRENVDDSSHRTLGWFVTQPLVTVTAPRAICASL